MQGQTKTQAVESVRSWIRDLAPGEPKSFGAIAVAVLYSSAPKNNVAYQLLAMAIASGDVEITETDDATVPTLMVRNRGALPVLIADFEEIVGGRQNRTVNTSILVPAGSDVLLPVSCVEQGRWAQVHRTFVPGEAVYPSLRALKSRSVTSGFAEGDAPRADQYAVWDDIEATSGSLGVHSRTRAMRDIFESQTDALEEALAALPAPTDGAIGVLCLFPDHATADVFDRPETLAAYWPRLVRSYALESLWAGQADTVVHADVRSRLQAALTARGKAFPSAGTCWDVRLDGQGVCGAALVHDLGVIHTSLFWDALDSRGTAARRRYTSYRS